MGLGKVFKAAVNIVSNPVQLVTIGVAASTGNWWYVAAAVSTATYGNYQTIRMEEKQRAAEQAAKDAYNNSLQDRLINVLSAEAPFQIIYGQTRVGGAIAAVLKSGDRDQFRHIVCVHAAHEVEEIGEIFVGETSLGVLDANGNCTTGKYANQVRVKKHLGTANDPADQTLIDETGGKWTPQHLLRGFAYTVVRIDLNQADFQTGIPQINAVIKGKKVVDIRTGTTAWSDNPALCIYDFITSEYGMGEPIDNIDTGSFIEAANDCDEIINVGKRYTCNGSYKTDQDPKQTLNSLCDSMAGFVTQSGGWNINAGVYKEPVLDLNESDLVGGVQIMPNSALVDTFNTVTGQFSNPDKAYVVTDFTPFKNTAFINEDGAEYSSDFKMHFTNSDQRCQNIARIIVERARQALVVRMPCTLKAWPLQCGDRVRVTNSAFGWNNKVFRVVEWTFNINAPVELLLQEDGATVYDEADAIVPDEFPNTGLSDPFFFGTVNAPTIIASSPNATNPSITLQVTTSSLGIVQYAEIWYSASATPSLAQMIFAGTTDATASNSPYTNGQLMPNVTLNSIPSGSWYFFVRMVNAIAKSPFSSASALVTWRPTTFQFTDRYLMVAYADSITGSGFSLNATNKSFYGLYNKGNTNPETNPALYTWYSASPTFGTNNFLLYTNRQNRRFSFATGGAVFATQTGAFVPSDTANYDQSIWQALPGGSNYIDLDARTGQLLTVGTSAISSSDGLLRVTNNANGTVVAQLEKFLDFGPGQTLKTSPVANLTIDIYGRVVGFTSPDNFYFTETVFSASSGQTTFSVSHTVGNILVFRSGCLLDTDDYTETSTTVVLNNACYAGEKIVVLNMRATTTDVYYEPLNITIASSTSNSITYGSSNSPYQYIEIGDKLTFSNSGSPTQYTVQSINYSTRVITFTTSISGATAGNSVYRYRASGATYRPFSRYKTTLSSASSYTPSDWQIRSGFELLFINGVVLNELDYDLTSGAINAFPSGLASGLLTVIQFSENNLSIPASNIANSLNTTIEGVTEYAFSSNPDAFELYANGVLLAKGYDFDANSSLYTLLNTPDNGYTLLQQQTFARVGAA